MIKKWLRRHLINLLVKHLYNGITDEDVLRSDKRGNLYYKGKQVDEEQVRIISEEARRLRESVLWKYLCNDMKYVSNKRMFEKSVSNDDMIFGKAMLFNIDVTEKKLYNLSRMR